MQKMFSHHTSAFRHTPAASASDDEDVNSSSSSEGPGRENEASHTKTTFSFRRTASINTFRRGRSSIFVSGEDVLSSDREDRGRVDSNPISAKKGAAGHPRRRRPPPPDGYLYDVHKTEESSAVIMWTLVLSLSMNNLKRRLCDLLVVLCVFHGRSTWTCATIVIIRIFLAITS